MGKNTKAIISGLSWAFGERILAQGITFLVSIILARVLAPEDYGVISLILVFINLANVFVVNGFGESLVQSKEATDKDFSTVFWCTFCFSLILYFVIFLFAPSIGSFYGNDELKQLLRVLAIKIPLSSVNTIQQAYVSRGMQFRKNFFSTLGGALVSGVIGILMALCGFGVWALIAQYLVNSLVSTLVLFFTIDWHPSCYFSLKSAKRLMDFAWKSTGAAFINELYTQICSLIIGKKYSTTDLAFYNRGNQFPSLIITNINSAICKVFFPVMSSLQENVSALKEFAKLAIKISSFVIFPLMTGLIGISENLVIVLLTEKWLPCVVFLRIFCLFWMTQPLQVINWQIMKAVGRSDLCLKLEVIKKIVGFLLIGVTMFISVEALAYCTLTVGVVSMLINMVPIKRIVDYSFLNQLKDILPSLLLSLAMGIIVWAIPLFVTGNAIQLLFIQILVGVFFYFGAARIFHVKDYILLVGYIQGIKSRLLLHPSHDVEDNWAEKQDNS